MSELISVSTLIDYQRDWTVQWHQAPTAPPDHAFYRLVADNHHWNYALWHEEDKARRDDKGFEYVYHAKRNIDRYNQQRNNMMEAMDAWIEAHLLPSAPSRDAAAMAAIPVHSETPGMMIDRLSILALKAYHMNLQVHRQTVDEAHQTQCAKKLTCIQAQLTQLAMCLDQLLTECRNGERTFRRYYQFKMYNDPNLNPYFKPTPAQAD